jgi:5-methylcytosine-specific restriction endonuclease McrA
MTRRVPAALRTRIRQQARARCGYCLSSEALLGMPMEFERLTPLAAGGQTVEENLWLSCRRCNQFKGTQTHALDPVTAERVVLFNKDLSRLTPDCRVGHVRRHISALAGLERAFSLE